MLRVALVFGAFCLAAFLKFNGFWNAPGFDLDHRTLYWTESAMHYYMADKVARGEPLDELDKRAQESEGVILSRDIAPAMPWLAGTAYRLWPSDVPLDIFIAYFFVLYASLTVVAIYLWGCLLAGPSVGVAAAYLYAVSAPAFVRSAGAFIKEDLALPALMLGFAYLFAAFRVGGRGRALIAGLFVSLALLSWHFSQFMLLCFAVVLALSVFVNGRLTDEQSRLLGLFTAVLALTATAFAMLRATAFVFSPAMSLLYAMTALHLWRRRGIAVLVFAASVSIYFWLGLAEQTHVFGLVIDKLRFGFVKPPDPTLLSYETRSNWIEDFNSPSLRFLIYTVSLYLPLGCLSLVRLAARSRVSRENFLIAGLGFIFLFFFAMARRMITIDIIFLSLAMGALLTVRHQAARGGLIALLALTFVYEGWKSFNYDGPNPVNTYTGENFPARDLPEAYTVADHEDILQWIRAFVNPDDTVLASMGFSPVILAYTGRPIVIHSMFDAKTMRDKVQEYVESLYDSEERFYRFAQRNGVRFFIYESRNLLMHGLNSDRYVAGKINPDQNSAVYKFQFRPDYLEHFQLVYQNTAYRVYRVGKDFEVPPILPNPVYQEGANSPALSEVFIRFNQKIVAQYIQGFQAGAANQVATAASIWEDVRRQAPYTLGINAQLCLAYMILNREEEARRACREELQYRPHSPVGHLHLAMLLEKAGHPQDAAAELRAALKVDPRYKKAVDMLTRLQP